MMMSICLSESSLNPQMAARRDFYSFMLIPSSAGRKMFTQSWILSFIDFPSAYWWSELRRSYAPARFRIFSDAAFVVLQLTGWVSWITIEQEFGLYSRKEISQICHNFPHPDSRPLKATINPPARHQHQPSFLLQDLKPKRKQRKKL